MSLLCTVTNLAAVLDGNVGIMCVECPLRRRTEPQRWILSTSYGYPWCPEGSGDPSSAHDRSLPIRSISSRLLGTRAWPRVTGLWFLNAIAGSPGAIVVDEISPAKIPQKMQSVSPGLVGRSVTARGDPA